jgi:hypothetical protein
MLLANGLANFIGVFFVNTMLFLAEGYPDPIGWIRSLRPLHFPLFGR